MARLFPRSRLARSLVLALAVLATYALLGFYAAPPLIHRAITTFAAEQLERNATLGEVRFNPLLFTLELRDFALAERDGGRILGFRRLFVDFETSSLARWAWTFSDIVLEEPAVRAEIGPDGTLNLAALVDKLPKSEPGAKPPRLLLHRFAMSGGAFTFSDRSDPTPASTVVRPIALELRDLSTLPDERGSYSINARLPEGGAVAWRGDMSLEPLSSSGEIHFTGLKPLTAWRFLRDELELEEPRGEVSFRARYRAGFTGATPQLAFDDIRVEGRGIVITAAGAKEPLLSIASVGAAGGRFDLATRELVLPAIRVSDGAVAVEVDRQGALNWAKLVKPDATRPAPAGGEPPRGAPWKARVEALRVEGVGLSYTDHSRRQPIALVAKDVAIELVAAATIQAGSTQALLERISLTLTGFTAGAPGEEPLAAFDTVALTGGALDLGERRAGAERVTIKGGLMKMVRDETGAVGAVNFVLGGEAGALRREVAGAEGRPWSIGVGALDAAGVRLALSDRSFAQPIALDAELLKARMAGFRSDGREPMKLDASVRIVQGGSITAAGTLRNGGEEVAGTIKVEGLSLQPLRPALLGHLRANLASGEVSAEMKGQYRAAKGRRELRGSGQARLDNLRIDEAKGGERLVGWKSLAVNGIRLSLAPDALAIEEARVTGVDAKVVVFKDRTVNLIEAFSRGGAAPSGQPRPEQPKPEPARDPAPAAEAEPVFPVTVGRVVFEGGAVDFADLSLVLPFSAQVHELAGAVQGISTDRDSQASVRLEGRVDEYGLARVEGRLRPFRPKAFMDLGVVFRNVDMPPLSAYSATFAGRRIASGRLALDLRYKIDNGALAGDNRVVLEKFTLGERVEAPGALNLPLDLAVALLTDSDGKIDLAVPVSGNVDDPKFSYGQVIWHALGNLISRIVTAPFRALAALFGGGSGGADKDMENIAFDPGRAALLPPEREKLGRLAEGLGKRPQLRVVAEGQYGPPDRAALRSREVEAAVAAKLGRPAAEGGVPDTVNVTDAKTQRVLEALFVERQSEQALEAFAAETEKARGKPVARVNAALALLGRASADREFYEALLKRLVESAPVPDAALAKLAGARADAVTEHLTSVLKVPTARVSGRGSTAPGGTQVKLALDVAPAAGAAGER